MVSELGTPIHQARKAQRERAGWEHRSYLALEQIADTLEDMRSDAISFQLELIEVLKASKL